MHAYMHTKRLSAHYSLRIFYREREGGREGERDREREEGGRRKGGREGGRREGGESEEISRTVETWRGLSQS
jgi:hypothetical protein